MDDKSILELFLARDENAIAEVKEKYSSYCGSVANNILKDSSDIEEALNDTWFAAWTTIPPFLPQCLRTYLARLIRNISFNKLDHDNAKKRGSGEYKIVLDEVSDWLVSDNDNVEDSVDERILTDLLNNFLAGLNETERNVFVRRYTYFQSISEISKAFGFSKSKVSSMLLRLRKRLRKELEENDI